MSKGSPIYKNNTSAYLRHVADWFGSLGNDNSSPAIKQHLTTALNGITRFAKEAVEEGIDEIPAIPPFINPYNPRTFEQMVRAWSEHVGVELRGDQNEAGEVAVIRHSDGLLSRIAERTTKAVNDWFTVPDTLNSVGVLWMDIDDILHLRVVPAIVRMAIEGDDLRRAHYRLRTRSDRRVWLIFKHGSLRFTLVKEGVEFPVLMECTSAPVRSIARLPKSFPDDILIPAMPVPAPQTTDGASP